MAESLGTILQFTEDLKDAEAPSALPKGDFIGEVSGAENGTGASGKPRIDITWLIRPENFPADYEDAAEYPDGKEVHTYLASSDTKANRYRISQMAKTLGVKKLGREVDLNDWIGKKAMLTNEPEEFEGVPRERITKVSAL